MTCRLKEQEDKLYTLTFKSKDRQPSEKWQAFIASNFVDMYSIKLLVPLPCCHSIKLWHEFYNLQLSEHLLYETTCSSVVTQSSDDVSFIATYLTIVTNT